MLLRPTDKFREVDEAAFTWHLAQAEKRQHILRVQFPNGILYCTEDEKPQAKEIDGRYWIPK